MTRSATAGLETWLDRNAPASVPEEPTARFAALRAWHAALHAGGWLGFGWPEELGGRPGSWADQAAVFAAIARRGLPQPVGQIGLLTVGPALLRAGSSAQRARYIPAILSADEIWCQGFSEPSAGSDLAALRTRADRVAGGYRIDGQKVWTSWAQYADQCAVLARTGTAEERHRGLTYLVVPMDAAGVEVRPIEQLTGEAEFNEVFLDGVEVGEDARIGDEGAGWRVALATLDYERTTYAITRQGDLAVAVRRLLAERPGGARVPARELGWALAESAQLGALARGAAARLAADDVSGISAVYKTATSQAEQAIGAALLGVVEADPAAWAGTSAREDARRLAAVSRSATIHGGTAQVLLGVVAEHLLGLPRSR